MLTCMMCETPNPDWPNPATWEYLYLPTSTQGPFCSKSCGVAWQMLPILERLRRVFGHADLGMVFLRQVAEGRYQRDERGSVEWLIGAPTRGKRIAYDAETYKRLGLPHPECPHPDTGTEGFGSCLSCRAVTLTLQPRVVSAVAA